MVKHTKVFPEYKEPLVQIEFPKFTIPKFYLYTSLGHARAPEELVVYGHTFPIFPNKLDTTNSYVVYWTQPNAYNGSSFFVYYLTKPVRTDYTTTPVHAWAVSATGIPWLSV